MLAFVYTTVNIENVKTKHTKNGTFECLKYLYNNVQQENYKKINIYFVQHFNKTALNFKKIIDFELKNEISQCQTYIDGWLWNKDNLL